MHRPQQQQYGRHTPMPVPVGRGMMQPGMHHPGMVPGMMPMGMPVRCIFLIF